MTYLADWKKKTEEDADPGSRDAFIKRYYAEEKEAYDRILSAHPQRFEGSASELESTLGFTDHAIFAGFIEGLNPSLASQVDLEALDENTPISLDIDFESLFWNMHEAKATWLHQLDSWDTVLDTARREDIVKRFRISKTATSSKTGRNDPCPCGSGRKFKVCCGRN